MNRREFLVSLGVVVAAAGVGYVCANSPEITEEIADILKDIEIRADELNKKTKDDSN